VRNQKKIKLFIDSQESDDERLLELTTNLHEELEQLDVETIRTPTQSSLQEGAKSGDVVTWGQLLLTLAASGGVLTSVIATLKAWLLRQTKCSIKVEMDGDVLEIKGVDSEDQRRIIDQWLARHPLEDK
jgi:hypothetical protein